MHSSQVSSAAAAVAVFSLASTLGVTSASSLIDRATEPFSFEKLEPSTDLKWTPCFQNFTCANLEVPLDYDDPSVGTTIVAFVKWTSKNPNASDILLNPGGPGQSGVGSLLGGGLALHQATVGTDYNLVGFDPRSVNNSGPSVSCFPDQAANENLFGTMYFRDIDVSSPRGLATRFAMGEAYGDWCNNALKGGPSKYANTVAVAQDMLHYTELIAKSKGQDPKEAKVWYWGMSYGTVLAQTFATLFPDRVGRIISDGNTDPIGYYGGKWNVVYYEADNAMRAFFAYCYEAGPKSCAFYDSSALAIERRFNKLLLSLEKNPVSVASSELVKVPAVLSDVDVRSAFRESLGAPLFPTGFSYMAQALSDLEKGNGTLLAPQVHVTSISANFTPDAKFKYTEGREQQIQISCNDANGRGVYPDFNAYAEYIEDINMQSAYMAAMAVQALPISCKNLEIRPPKNQVFDPDTIGKKPTSYPLLFIGNAIDPVTPLTLTQAGHQRFNGSGILVQNNVGHTSLAAPSKCTAKWVQQYLKDGSVPPANTTCEPDVLPFQDQ